MESPKVVCAWCQVLLRDGALPISHSICPPCAADFDPPVVSDVERTIEEAQRQHLVNV